MAANASDNTRIVLKNGTDDQAAIGNGGGDLAFKEGDVAWVLTSTTLVFIMIPGLAFFYGGMARSKHTLSLILAVILCVAVVSIQWWIWGYSLAFGTSTTGFIGNLDNAFFMDVLDQADPAPTVPRLLFAMYQCMFAAITPALALGAAAERGRILPMICFTFVWSTLVYDVIACWTWNPKGWSAAMGGLDFAGGTPVHIASGAASLAYCIIIGKRDGKADDFKPHNIVHVVLGTGLLWFGWFGFNGGSALAANMRAIMACVVTNLAASSAGATWVLIDYIRGRKLSALAFCSGAVAGLVGITPASGFVGTWAAFVIGVVTAVACNMACKLKGLIGFDDAVDVFGVHAVGGMCGNIMTAFFADYRIVALDKAAVAIPGGWVNGNWIQLAYQLADSAAGFSYSFVATFIILSIMNRIPGLSLRADAETEAKGMDLAELGELAYHYIQSKASVVTPPAHSFRAPAGPTPHQQTVWTNGSNAGGGGSISTLRVGDASMSEFRAPSDAGGGRYETKEVVYNEPWYAERANGMGSRGLVSRH